MPSEPPTAVCSSSSRGFAPPSERTNRPHRDRHFSKTIATCYCNSPLIFTAFPIFCFLSLSYAWLISWVNKLVYIVIETLANPWIIFVTFFVVLFMIILTVLGAIVICLPMFLLAFGLLYDDTNDEIIYFIGRYVYPYFIGIALSAGYLYLVFNHSKLLTYLSNCM